MTPTLRRQCNISTIASSLDSSDYDDVLPYKRARLERSKSMQRKLKKLCDSEENSSNGAKSAMHRNIANGYLNVRKINTKNKTNQEVSNDTDTDSRNPVKSTSQDSDGSSYNSSDSLMESQKKFKKLSNNKKGRSNEILRETKKCKDYSSNSNSSDAIIFSSRKEEGRKSEQETVQDFKPLVTKIGKELNHKFSKFKTQINELQSKYVKDNIVTLQDAGQTLFIFNCIISKLKEELTEEQQHLTNSYIQWSTKHKCNRIVSNIHNKQCTKSIANDNNLQVQNKSLQSSSNNNIRSADAYKYKLLEATKNLQETVQGDDKNSEGHENIRNDESKQLLEVVDTVVSIPQTSNDNGLSENNHNVMSQNNHNLLSGSSDLSKFKSAETSAEISKINNEESKEKTFLYSETLSSSSKDSQELFSIEGNLSINELRTERTQIINCDSDVSSTCSTVALFPREIVDIQQIEEYESDLIQADELENLIVNNISNKRVNDEVATPRLFRSDSNDTVVIPLSKTNNPNIQCLKDKQNKKFKMPAKTFVASSNKENSICQEDSDFVLPVASIKSRNTTHCSFPSSRNSEIKKENNSNNKRIDNKLQMNCQVLVKKFKS